MYMHKNITYLINLLFSLQIISLFFSNFLEKIKLIILERSIENTNIQF